MEDPPMADVPALTEAYQDARKAYGLAGALLIALELIGIDFGATPIESINVTLKSPQAVPYILVVLVLYFALRLTIEWKQSHPGRRAMVSSRVDFALAHFIGISSLILYGIQALLRIQIADKVPPPKFLALMFGFMGGQMSMFAITRLLFTHYRQVAGNRLMGAATGLAGILSLVVIMIRMPSLFGYAFVGALFASVLHGLFELWLWRRVHRIGSG